MPTGIDVSKWNGAIDWAQVRGAGHDWSACKASTGCTGVDRRFAENWQAMRDHGFRWRAAYHWVTNADPATQVRHFLDVVGDLRPGETLVADAEDAKVPEAVHRAFLEQLAAAIAPRRPIYYAYAGSPGYQRFGDFPTWYAGYVRRERAEHLSGRAWLIWQHDNEGAVPGISGHVDLNEVADPAALDAITLLDPSAQPQPEDWFDMATKEDLEGVINAAILKAIDALRRDDLGPLKQQLDAADEREAKRWTELFASGAPRKA